MRLRRCSGGGGKDRLDVPAPTDENGGGRARGPGAGEAMTRDSREMRRTNNATETRAFHTRDD